MSKLSQELRALLYLNDHVDRDEFIPVRDIANYLDVSERQARRYMEDLSMIHEIDMKTRLGREGGYRLGRPLSKGLAMAENIALALAIAMKRNERVEQVLAELPNYVVADVVEGDNLIDNDVMDRLESLITAIKNHRSVTFRYKDYEDLYFVDPYKIFYTNHTYYLKAVHQDVLKNFDVFFVQDIKSLGGFRYDPAVEKRCLESLASYGLREGKASTLRVKCKDEKALHQFERYFEGRGHKDLENLTYQVEASDQHELYYPLFRISTKSYEFLDEEFKEDYIRYLENITRSLRRK